MARDPTPGPPRTARPAAHRALGAAGGERPDAETHALLLARLEQQLAAVARIDEVKAFLERAAHARAMLLRDGSSAWVQVQFAELEIRCARRLGELLRVEAHRGGRGSTAATSPRRGGSSSPLPGWISWNRSSRCQRLAAIPAERFEAELQRARAQARPVSQARLLRELCPREPLAAGGGFGSRGHGNGQGGGQDGGQDGGEDTGLSVDSVWRRIRRVMEVDVAVGLHAEGRAQARGASDAAALRMLHGNVVVDAAGDESRWLDAIHEARRVGRIREGIAFVRMQPEADWFGRLGAQGWICCFPLQRWRRFPCAIAYQGARWFAFEVCFRELGTVLRGAP